MAQANTAAFFAQAGMDAPQPVENAVALSHLIFSGVLDLHHDVYLVFYFAFVIGMMFQVSDVQVTNKGIRRLVTAHGMVSFLFNTTVIALMVNLATDAF